MKKYKEKLRNITEILLEEEENYGKLKKACDDLFDLFSEISKLDVKKEEANKDYFLPGGKAIGTVWAGRCVKEFMRTKKFLTGIYKAIWQAKGKFPGQPLHILYAGSGPFGTLLVPLTTKFGPDEIQITFLDINPESLKNLRILVRELDIAAYVEDIVLCDASKYQAEGKKPIHMVVTETMQRALCKEPQVSIVDNLVSQMTDGGILIPQNIKIDAVLLDSKRDMERMRGVSGAERDFYFYIDTILELNQKSIKEYNKEEHAFPEKVISIPENVESRFNRFSLFTDIQVFEEEILTYMQCSLNLPYYIMERKRIKDEVKGGEKIGFQYFVSENPDFEYRQIT